MLKRFWLWLLSFFLTGKQEAELSAAQQAGADYDQQQVSAITAQEAAIDAHAEEEKQGVDGMTAAEVTEGLKK